MVCRSGQERRAVSFWVMAGLLLFLMSGAPQALAQEITPEIYNGMRYRYIGPPGNRTAAVCGQAWRSAGDEDDD